MRAQFALVPLAALSIVVPAHAVVYLSIEQAQSNMFPGATFTPEFKSQTKEQAAAIEKASGISVRNPDLKLWRVSTGGWFIADQVVGKHEYIPIAVGLGADGAVKAVEILEYREAYGDQVRNPAGRGQFSGKKHGAQLALTKDIQNISGATLSSRHITDGIKRLLATYAIAIAQD